MATTAGPGPGGPPPAPRSLGQHIASRLAQVGVNHAFCVPGDYNLTVRRAAAAAAAARRACQRPRRCPLSSPSLSGHASDCHVLVPACHASNAPQLLDELTKDKEVEGVW